MTTKREFSLNGMNIGITGLDLEQSEHRGIAQFTKSMIAALSSEKANIYLITGYKGSRLKTNYFNSIS